MGIDKVEVPISADEPLVMRAVPYFRRFLMFLVICFIFQFSWLCYFSVIIGIDGVEVPIIADEPIVVRAVPYFQKMFNVLDYLFVLV